MITYKYSGIFRIPYDAPVEAKWCEIYRPFLFGFIPLWTPQWLGGWNWRYKMVAEPTHPELHEFL